MTTALAAETANAITQSEIPWSIAVPIITVLINALVVYGSLAYTFGVAKQRLQAVETDMDRFSSELDKMRESSHRVDDRVHEIAVAMARVEVLLSTSLGKDACPLNARRAERALKKEASE